MVILAVGAAASVGEKFTAGAMERRLFASFSWPGGVPSPDDIANDANKLIEDTGNTIGDAATTSFDFVKQNFQQAEGLLKEGHQVVTAAWDATSQFGNDMNAIYDEFKPLEKVFAAHHGLIPLLTNEDRLGLLTKVLLDLVRSTGQVVQIGNAVGAVVQVFGHLNSMFNSELSKLTPVDGRRLQDQNLTTPLDGRRLLDYTSLLDGLNFDAITNSFNDFSEQAKEFNETLSGIRETLEPVLERLESHLEGRRLIIDQDEIARDQWKYEGAVRGVIPAWQSVEGMVKDACTQTEVALEAVSSLECRIKGFASQPSIPGMDQVSGLVGTCEKEAAKEADKGDCPAASHSAGVRDMLSSNAGAIGWMALSFEYAFENSLFVRIVFATILLAIGIGVGFFGYMGKDCEFWFEGFLAGIVVWTTVIAIIVCWFGVCREGLISTCDPTWIFVIVMILSVGCAFLSCKAQKFQFFVSGFDLGAVLAGVIYMIIYRREVFDAFLDPEAARVVISGLLCSTLLTGLLFGVLTVYFSKAMIVIATSAVGATLIIFAIYLYFDHSLGWPDVIAMVFVTGIAIAVQYLVTAKGYTKTDYGEVKKEDDGDNEAPTSG